MCILFTVLAAMMKFATLLVCVSLYVAGGSATYCFNCARIESNGEEYDPSENGFPGAERCPEDGFAGAIDCGPFAGCQSRKIAYNFEFEDGRYQSEVMYYGCGPSENKCYVGEDFQEIFEKERPQVEAGLPEGHRLIDGTGSICNCNGRDFCSASGATALNVGRSTVMVLVSSVLFAVSAMRLV